MSQPVRKICHITTVHPRYDIRIYQKECLTLAPLYSVNMIVADGKGDCYSEGINIIDAGAGGSRIKRILLSGSGAYKKAISLDCDLYHFHDPEFLLHALRLVRRGKKVIYDVHEDVPKQTMSKEYISPVFRKLIAFSVWSIEKFISSRLSAVITVTESIRTKFTGWNQKCVVINNYPVNTFPVSLPAEKRDGLCYIGVISRIRGIETILDALLATNTVLHLAGEFETLKLREKLFSHPAWKKVKYYGTIGSAQAREIMSKSVAGLAIYLPFPNHIESQPNKIFEYMSCGTPVIGSDFPLWNDIIKRNGCGLCINPEDPEDLANAIESIFKDRNLAKQMGLNGLNMIRDKYNWETESRKLINLYHELLN